MREFSELSMRMEDLTYWRMSARLHTFLMYETVSPNGTALCDLLINIVGHYHLYKFIFDIFCICIRCYWCYGIFWSRLSMCYINVFTNKGFAIIWYIILPTNIVVVTLFSGFFGYFILPFSQSRLTVSRLRVHPVKCLPVKCPRLSVSRLSVSRLSVRIPL